MCKNELTSRGGAKKQDKNWSPFILAQQTRFIHAGSPPFSKDGGTGILLRFAKEDITVAGHPRAPTKYNLAFPLSAYPPGTMPPDKVTLAKAAQMLWEIKEMPRAFVFTLDAGVQLWTMNGQLNDKQEVGIAFDVLWIHSLVAEYKRTNKAEAIREV
ncbi:MAG: hypothetical protein ABL925_00540 [Methylococcales bacterium]